MNEKRLKKILDIIREGMMSTQSTTNKPGFSSSADATGPVAGFDPVMKKKKKTYIKLMPGSRKRWMKGDGN